MSKVERPFCRCGNPALWGAIASIVIVTATVWLFFQQVCTVATDGDTSCQTKLAYLVAAPPNEVGDTIAGVAGVLAFIWIVVTVAMQAEELRAQREVLRMTRDEMEEQRRATQDMARSLATQADIFEDERKHRNWAMARNALDERLDDIMAHIESESRLSGSWCYAPSGFHQAKINVFLKDGSSEVDGNLRDEKFRNVTHRVNESVIAIIEKSQSGAFTKRSGDRDYYEGIFRKLQNVLDMMPDLSDDQKERVDSIGVCDILASVDALIHANVWQVK